VKLASSASAFVFNLVLARLLGPVGNGYFALAQTASVLGATLGKLGLDNTVLRFVSGSAQDPGEMRKFLRVAFALSVAASLVATGLLYVTAPWVARDLLNDERSLPLVRQISLATLPFALSTLLGLALVGLKRTVDGLAAQLLIMPFTGSILALAAVPVWGVAGSVHAYTGSSVLALLFAMWRWNVAVRGLPKGQAEEPVVSRLDVSLKAVLASCMPLLAMSLIQFVLKWSPNVLVGMWSTVEDVGIFNVASRTAFLLAFILSAVNMTVAPTFTELHLKGDYEELGRIARRSAQVMAVMAFPFLVLFLAAPNWVMSIYGPGFAVGGAALAVMAIGQYVNVVTGSVQHILMMTGRESALSWLFVGLLPFHFLLMWLLTPPLGALGAGIASSILFVAQNLICAYMVYRFTGIWTLPKPRELLSVRKDLQTVIRKLKSRGAKS
jgi:O-antigen/teichoic acid export membrane protein